MKCDGEEYEECVNEAPTPLLYARGQEGTPTAFIVEFLTDEGYTVRTALHSTSARAAIVVQRHDLMLLDLHLPGKPGDILVQDLKDDGLDEIPIILMTADARAAQELSM